MVDIDGVLSLFGAPTIAGQRSLAVLAGDPDEQRRARRGRYCSIDGIPHFLSYDAAAHLLALADSFELVWASGWEEKANEHLPHLLGMPGALPFVRFPRAQAQTGDGDGHWKLAAIDSYAGARALAWIDDGFNPACHAWASARAAPTLLVATEPEQGLTTREAQVLQQWAARLARP
ncbi:MAG TPA: HAD domain-containing protein [Solirubrobacteraceae bacterium]|nr:HAD domain-containing protein [Solirubrobacteraceae bacterium]